MKIVFSDESHCHLSDAVNKLSILVRRKFINYEWKTIQFPLNDTLMGFLVWWTHRYVLLSKSYIDEEVDADNIWCQYAIQFLFEDWINL